MHAARRAAALTQAELAVKIGVKTTGTIRYWERGCQCPRPGNLIKLATALDIGMADLLRTPAAQPTLRSLRLDRGLTMQQVAERSGLTMSTYHRLEHGLPIRKPDNTTITALGRTLKVRKVILIPLIDQSHGGD